MTCGMRTLHFLCRGHNNGWRVYPTIFAVSTSNARLSRWYCSRHAGWKSSSSAPFCQQILHWLIMVLPARAARAYTHKI